MDMSALKLARLVVEHSIILEQKHKRLKIDKIDFNLSDVKTFTLFSSLELVEC